MKYYSQLIHVEKNNELANYCNKKMKELNNISDNFKTFEFTKWKKYFKEMAYYHAVCTRILKENEEILNNLKKENKMKCSICNKTLVCSEHGTLGIKKSIINIWYSLVVKDNGGFRYLQNEEGQNCEYETLDQANEDRIYYQSDYAEQIFILKETREIVK